MNDIITNALSQAGPRKKPMLVIKRYLKLKYNILIADDVLNARMLQLNMRS